MCNSVFQWRYLCLRQVQLFLKCALYKVHTAETNALSRSWKKTATAVGVSVSKLYVTFCGSSSKLRASWTLCPGSKFTKNWTQPHTEIHPDALGQTRAKEWPAPRRGRSPAQHKTNTKHQCRFVYRFPKPAIPVKKALQIYTSDLTASGFDVAM